MRHLFDSPRTIGGSNWNKLFRKSMIKNFYDESLRICEDNVFLCQYSLLIQKAVFINETLYHIYERSTSAIRRDGSVLVESLPARQRIIDIVSPAGNLVRQLAEKDFLDTGYSYYVDQKNKNEEKSYQSRRYLKQYLHKKLFRILMNKHIYWKTKLLYFLF